MKLRYLSVLLLFPLIFVGCDSLFDEGDVEATYDGPNQVAFFPLETNTSDGSGTATVDVQLITSSSSGSSSAITINFSTGGDAVSGTHYTIAGGNSVTIPAGEFSATVTVNLIADSVPAGGEVLLTLTMDDATGAELAANLDEADRKSVV